MSKITELTKPLRRWIKLDGQFYVLTFTPEGITAKVYRRRQSSAVHVPWNQALGDPRGLPLFTEDSHAITEPPDDFPPEIAGE